MKNIYEKQKMFQEKVIEKFGYYGDNNIDIPVDNVAVCSYHMLALLEEVGELVKSDKRWKNFRNNKFDKENKMEELCDCFITLMNVALFSGFSGEDIEHALISKIDENYKRCFDNDHNC